MRKKRARRPHSSSILHCPEAHWFLPRESAAPRVLPCGDPMDPCSYADLKLGPLLLVNGPQRLSSKGICNTGTVWAVHTWCAIVNLPLKSSAVQGILFYICHVIISFAFCHMIFLIIYLSMAIIQLL